MKNKLLLLISILFSINLNALKMYNVLDYNFKILATINKKISITETKIIIAGRENDISASNYTFATLIKNRNKVELYYLKFDNLYLINHEDMVIHNEIDPETGNLIIKNIPENVEIEQIFDKTDNRNVITLVAKQKQEEFE